MGASFCFLRLFGKKARAHGAFLQPQHGIG